MIAAFGKKNKGCFSSKARFSAVTHTFCSSKEIVTAHRVQPGGVQRGLPRSSPKNAAAPLCKVANKYEFAAKSAEAYALLYEAATNNVQIQRATKKHNSNFPLAFAGVSHYVTGNLKTAAREIRKELLAEIRKCVDARAVREVITFVDANNDDRKLLGTDDELKDNDLFEELMDVLKRVPSLNNVHHLARMPDTQIGEWEPLTVYLVDIIALDATPSHRPASRATALSAHDGGRRPRWTWRARRMWRA